MDISKHNIYNLGCLYDKDVGKEKNSERTFISIKKQQRKWIY